MKDPAIRQAAIDSIERFVASQQMRVLGVIDSPIAGPAGNLEALLAAVRTGA